MSVEQHKQQAKAALRCKVITISDTRNEESDLTGQFLKEQMIINGHTIVAYEIVTDDVHSIQQAVLSGCERKLDVILLNGGTGLSQRDVTIEALSPLFEKEITGFGELFRMLSYTEDIGSAALLSRAIAGVIGLTAVFSVPGSRGAAKLALDKLIAPEIGHIVAEINK
ncbi:molybdenum cofactor biosynthesis protein B [Fictibacillus macauensis ZFHKF-1]|uniref:Molybdenum cofactor biosynthesis protein B n=1 Tax=Fictibacillus macauensis ZFHKF-1 TaxID=1196324 RepID=I8UHK9_9BACL|nr:molybdenum cofactor biosynthesis protein B [Fictibacillus macauensis]EIT86308.1 molybdenum cofactor biosynthesis protein B [Fictibacillus macauensis ZFHKF-1]